MEIEEQQRNDISYCKAKAKNNAENNILVKRLKQIDKQCRGELIKIEKQILKEKRFSRRLKIQRIKYKRQDSVDEVIMKKLKNIKSMSAGLPEQARPRTSNSTATAAWAATQNAEENISVNGRRVTHEPFYVPPKMFFWSQDSSTKEAVLTGFYGYRPNFKRTMTDIKLLGQDTYVKPKPQFAEHEIRRDIQTADAVLRTCNVRNDVYDRRLIKTSDYPKVSEFDEDLLDRVLCRVPPPSREVTRMALENNAIPEEADTAQAPQRVNDVKPKRLDHSLLLPKPPETPVKPGTADGLMINMRRSDSTEQLVSQRTAGVTSRGSLRTPTIKMKRLLPERTREEATRELQEFMKQRARSPRAKAKRVLERSYTQVPAVISEASRVRSDTEPNLTMNSGQYTKSKYNLEMQSVVSKKVLKKGSLPAHFRKSNNTILKHYGTPRLENKDAKVFSLPLPV